MTEVQPQFTYADRRLVFTLPEETDLVFAKQRADMLEELDNGHFSEIQEASAQTTITTDVSPFLQKGPYTHKREKTLRAFLTPLAQLLPYESTTDVALGLFIGPHGPATAVYPSFQTWLQAKGVQGDMLIEASLAMHEVFGIKPKQSMTHWDIAVGLVPTEFEIISSKEGEDLVYQKRGVATLAVPFIQTLGDCACLGSPAHTRSIFVDRDHCELYNLDPHNVDNLQQTLSMIVGLGRLAAFMPHEYDETALFSDLSWEEAAYPKVGIPYTD